MFLVACATDRAPGLQETRIKGYIHITGYKVTVAWGDRIRGCDRAAFSADNPGSGTGRFSACAPVHAAYGVRARFEGARKGKRQKSMYIPSIYAC